MENKQVFYRTEDDELAERKGSIILDDAVEPSIENVRRIVTQHQYLTFQWEGRKTQVLVDAQSAILIVKVYDAVNEENKAKVERMIKKSKGSFVSLVSQLWKMV